MATKAERMNRSGIDCSNTIWSKSSTQQSENIRKISSDKTIAFPSNRADVFVYKRHMI